MGVDVARAIGAGEAIRRRFVAAARVLEVDGGDALAEVVAVPAAAERIDAVDVAIAAANLVVDVRLMGFPLLQTAFFDLDLGHVGLGVGVGAGGG